MTRTDLKQQLDILLDKYEAIENRPRAQTHRDAIANSAMEVLLQWRRLHEKQPSSAPVAPPPAEWPRARIRRKGWNGACKGCKKPGLVGQLVAWDPASGRPSAWQHVDCAHPWGQAADGSLRGGGR